MSDLSNQEIQNINNSDSDLNSILNELTEPEDIDSYKNNVPLNQLIINEINNNKIRKKILLKVYHNK